MSQYGEVWTFTRGRLEQAYQDLSDAQLRWRPHPESHCIGEMVYHVAGVEIWFGLQMSDTKRTAELAKLSEAARASYITGDPFPFDDSDMTKQALDAALETAYEVVGPVIENPSSEQLTMQVETVIGPVVNGVACLWRIAQHAAYHTGQIWTYRMDPGFPA
jgi:hypothetical protein